MGKIQVSSDMLTRSRTLLTKLLARNDHGQAFVNQVNNPLLFSSQILQRQQQVRGVSKDVATMKSLFNFHPAGVMDPDVAKVNAALKKAVAAAKSRGFDPEVELSPQQYAAHMRRWIDGYFKKLAKHPTYLAAVEGCKHEELIIPVEEGEGGQVRVLVHTPAHLANREKNAGLVYAHGGAVLSGSAQLYKPHLSLLSINCDMPVFNVDYRLAPESKCPQQAIDFSSVLIHLSSNASSFGLDAQRLAAAGESGGGDVCMSDLVHLAMRGQTGLVKLALPIVPMLSDYFLTTSPKSMTEEERFNVAGMRASWKALAQDLEAQWDSAILFPDKAPQELLANLPPTVVISAEFDMFITETERFVGKLRRAGSLSDFCCMPGIGHGHFFDASLACHHRFHQHFKLAIDKYLLE